MPRATNTYERIATAIPPRETEAAAFAFVNRGLERAADREARIAALGRNQKLWSLLLQDVALSSNGLPDILKGDLVRIGGWSMRYSIQAMTDDRPLEPLLAINRDMIAALTPDRPAAPPPAPVPAAPPDPRRRGLAAAF